MKFGDKCPGYDMNNNTEDNLGRLPMLLLFAWAVPMAVLIFRTMWLCDGRLVYTLDDPYIHLAVADKIGSGVYGVNMGEYSSPCSSIIFPLLLAVTEFLGLGSAAPLFVNLIAMGGVVFLVGAFLRQHAGMGLWATFALGILICANINAWGLVMTGMEHSLHLFMVAVVVIGLVNLESSHGSDVPWWLAVSIFVMPLVRFEGAALSAAALGVLWLSDRRRPAVWIAFALLMALAAWAAFMISHGLPVMPSSVQIKSSSVSGVVGNADIHSTLAAIRENAVQNIRNRQGHYMLAIQFAIILMIWFAPSISRQKKLLGLMVLAAGLAHLFFGRYGWFSRYEIYLFLACILTAVILVRPYVGSRPVRALIFVFPILAAVPYVRSTMRSPAASKNIYEQQYQMGRFAQELWRKPVAINDLGLVSYRNQAYVLDLAGLGSEKVRKLIQARRLNSDQISHAVAEKKIELAMIYESWFPGSVPPAWIKVATLHTSQVVAASGQVSFFATNAAAAEEIKGLLPEFAKGLPSGARLEY